MVRHIIVEGTDGTGKTGLIKYLTSAPEISSRFKLHERASSSIGGPVSNLDNWTADDVLFMGTKEPAIYDRHPIISEPIYGPICRNRMPGLFTKPVWVHHMTRLVEHYCLIIWCMPPLAVVQQNVENSEHMPGVKENIVKLYLAYQRKMEAWGGVSMRYDYTKVTEDHVITRLMNTQLWEA